MQVVDLSFPTWKLAARFSDICTKCYYGIRTLSPTPILLGRGQDERTTNHLASSQNQKGQQAHLKTSNQTQPTKE
jgi:hypothetical protein